MNKLGEKQLVQKKSKLHQRLQDFYAQTYKDKDVTRLANRLEKHNNEILTFLDNPDVTPDNNHAERQLRPAVISRKNSYCNRSENGAVTQAIIMTIFRTLYLRNLDPIASLMNMIQHNLNHNNFNDWEVLCTSVG